MTALRCGRLTDHDPHDWHGRRQPWQTARTYHCTGHTLTEMANAHYAAAADRAEGVDR